ncbi:Hemin transport protein [Pseudoxanthomonas gei]|nr:Hemin transport protein [Pseudoxanthomonas gei]
MKTRTQLATAQADASGRFGTGPAYSDVPRNASSELPRVQQLAALGTVLCLYHPRQGSELSGWVQAVRAESRAGMDSEDLRESVAFFDSESRCCWRLYLLPDSDFLAWDHLLESLPGSDDMGTARSVDERLWRRLTLRLLGGQCHACILRLHALPSPMMAPVLAASLATLSPFGIATARRIAQAEGAEENFLRDNCRAPPSPAFPGGAGQYRWQGNASRR